MLTIATAGMDIKDCQTARQQLKVTIEQLNFPLHLSDI